MDVKKVWKKRIEEGIVYQHSTLMRSPVAPVELGKSGFLYRFSIKQYAGWT